ncbi:MAG: hypothetical protein ACSLE2_20020 [Lysobacterales bacterium]
MRLSLQGKIAGLVLGVFLCVGIAEAALITNGSGYRVWTTDIEALAHAEEYCSVYIAKYPTGNPACQVGARPDVAGPSYAGAWEAQFCSAFGSNPTSGSCPGTPSGTSVDKMNYYQEIVDPCEDAPDITGITAPAIANADGLMVPQLSNPYCHEGCTYNMSNGGMEDEDCTYIDANDNGGVDEGEEGACPVFAYPDPAGSCTTGEAFPTSPTGGATCSGAQCTVAPSGTGPGGQPGQPGIPNQGGTTTTGSPGLPGADIGDDDADGTCEPGEECYEAGNRWDEAIWEGLVGDNDGAGYDTGLGPDDYLDSGEGDAAGMFENAKKNRNRDDDKWEDALQDYLDDAEQELSGIFVGAGTCPIIDFAWHRGWPIHIDTTAIGEAMRGIIAWIMWITIGIWTYLYLYRAATKSE